MTRFEQLVKQVEILFKEMEKLRGTDSSVPELLTAYGITFQNGGILNEGSVLCVRADVGFNVVTPEAGGKILVDVKLMLATRPEVHRGDIVYMDAWPDPSFDDISGYYVILGDTWAVHWDDGSAMKTDVVLSHIWKVVL